MIALFIRFLQYNVTHGHFAGSAMLVAFVFSVLVLAIQLVLEDWEAYFKVVCNIWLPSFASMTAILMVIICNGLSETGEGYVVYNRKCNL